MMFSMKKCQTLILARIIYMDDDDYDNQGIFFPSLRAKFWPHSQSKIATFFPNTMSVFPNKESKLEDLKVLRRSPDLLNNCKTGQILFYHIWGLQPFWSSNLNNLTAQ